MDCMPHGGVLINRELTDFKEINTIMNEAPLYLKVPIDEWTKSDIECICMGAFSPLKGFMNKEDYLSVLENMRLSNGTIWSIPITLPVSEEIYQGIAIGNSVALMGSNNEMYALLHVSDKYIPNKELEAKFVYQTTDLKHPGVSKLMSRPPCYLAGDIQVLKKPKPDLFLENYYTPHDTRHLFQEFGWKKIVGFQTRNPIHRAHEYIQKSALETVDGLMIHPLIGETKADDIPASVRMESYRILLEKYYPKNRVLLNVFPAAMRYAGPREAIYHALVRKNYGCTHFIVGRDHAGVGSYYGTYDAQKIFEQFSMDELGIVPLFFENSFYCSICNGMASYKTCPHDESHHFKLSGTKVREKLRQGEVLPEEFTRKEVAQILIKGMSSFCQS